MFLDTFMDDASEGIMQNPIPDLEDLQLECAVSLEAAYNDAMLEMYQLKYQALVEGVDVIHEGVIESIKSFFGKLFNAIKKLFGISSSSDASSQNIDKLKKQFGNNRIAAGIRYMLKRSEIAEKYKLIGYDTIFLGKIDLDSCICTAANRAIDRIKGDSKPNGDEISLDALRTFIKSAFGSTNKINADQINSLADYKKALYDNVQIVPMNELYKNDYNKLDHDVQMWLNEMNAKVANADAYKKSLEKNIQIYEKQVINIIAKEYPNRLSIAYKAIKIISQACIVTITYGQWLNDRVAQLFGHLFNAASNINIKEN